MGKQLRPSDRSPLAPQMVPADDSREGEYTADLTAYYDEVIACLRPASAILVFGAGEAKSELVKHIERNKLDVRVNRFETADRMTERQVLQKVRLHYAPVAQGL
jgi:hypothetical protein